MELSRGKLAVIGGGLGLIALIAWLAKREPVTPYTSTNTTTSSSGATSIEPTVTIPVVPSGSLAVPVKNLPPPQEIEWGTGSGALGHKLPKEGNPEAPMSLAIGPDGTRWVLDQVNDRIVRYDKNGKVIDTIPLTVKGAQDIVATKDGGAVVLDRLADKRAVIVGPDGKVSGTLTLEGKGLPEGGAATGVFVDGNNVYVEREHEQLVKLGDTKGNADPDRKEIPGRPTRDGSGYIRAWLGEVPGQRAFVTFTNKEPEAHRFTRQLNTTFMATGIVLLDTDRTGIIYLGVLGGKPSPSGELGDPFITVYCLEPAHGAPIGTATVPANTSPEETFRELAVLDEGGVLYMKRSEKGITVTPIDCRGGS